jgi:diguanylate cyclase (GGDEF)-like protein
MHTRDRVRMLLRARLVAWRTRAAVGRTPRYRAAERRALRGAIVRVSVVVAAVLLGGAAISTAADPLVGWELLALNGTTAAASLLIAWLVQDRGRHHVLSIAYLWGLLLAADLFLAGLTSPLQLRNAAMIMAAMPLIYALFMPWPVRAQVLAVGWTTVAALLLTFALAGAGVDPVSPIALTAVVTGAISVIGHAHRWADRIEAFRQYSQLRSLHLRSRQAGRRLRDANRELATSARVDPLTGAGNRRMLDEDLRALELEGEAAARGEADGGRAARGRGSGPVALVLVDLDRFKGYNDRHGHLAGDWVLRRVTDALVESVRDADRVYRYGGEELLALLVGVDATTADAIVDRMLLTIQGLEIPHPENRPWKVVTASAGWAIHDPFAGASTAVALVAADEALYRAKRLGRNRAAGHIPPDLRAASA